MTSAQHQENPNRWGRGGQVYHTLTGLQAPPSQTESQSRCGPVKAESSPCSSHCIFTAGHEAATHPHARWSLAGSWKKQARLLLQKTNINSNKKQDSAPTRSYLLRTRDKNLFTYKFSALLNIWGFFKYRRCVGELCGKHWCHLFHGYQCQFVKLGYQIHYKAATENRPHFWTSSCLKHWKTWQSINTSLLKSRGLHETVQSPSFDCKGLSAQSSNLRQISRELKNPTWFHRVIQELSR